MKVLKIIEHKDGSATLDLDFAEGEIKQLVEFAVVEMLKNGIKESGHEQRIKKGKRKK